MSVLPQIGKGGTTGKPMAHLDTIPIRILLATLNGAAHLQDQLDSIANQTHRKWELWVSDDGSMDDTLQILQRFSKVYPVHILNGPKQGSAANFLSLICHPSLPDDHCIALCDQDDIWHPQKLALALTRLADVPKDKPALYAAESVLVTQDLRPIQTSSAHGAQPDFGNALVQNLFSGHTSVLNPAGHKLLRAAGKPEGIAFHDWWIYQLVAGAGGRLILDETAVADYRQHVSNAFGARPGLPGLASRLASLRRGDFRTWSEANRTALRKIDHLLTEDAREKVRVLTSPDCPQGGFARLRLFQRLGLHRSHFAGTVALWAAAFLGRV